MFLIVSDIRQDRPSAQSRPPRAGVVGGSIDREGFAKVQNSRAGLLFTRWTGRPATCSITSKLERLESEYDLPLISVSQPTENTRAGRMMRRTLANMANFYTEQQSVDVREDGSCPRQQ
jgi:hypothetical protein